MVEPDALFIEDGPFITGPGISAGTDLALAIVEDDYGTDLARRVARWLVVFLQRPEGQAQFSVWNETSSPATPALREVLDSVVLDPAANHSTAAMAARAAMSERHLTRIFREEVGMTPASYVEQARLEAAKLLLVTSEDSQECVARRAGFGTAETMRRIFHRNIGVSRASTARVSAPLESSVPALHPACPSGSFRDRYQTIAAMRPHHRAKGAAPELVVV